MNTLALVYTVLLGLCLTQLSHSFSITPTSIQCKNSLDHCFMLSMSEADVQSEGDQSPPQPEVKCPDCDLCDGSGRILGGIPTILPWWPIKPYRPCPNFIKNGGQYSRIGQPLDEIAFGRGNIESEEDDDF